MKKLFFLLSLILTLSACMQITPNPPVENKIKITHEFLLEKLDESYLDLRNLNLTEIPDFTELLTQETRETVLYLDLSSNQLTEINQHIQDFPNLFELNLAYNKITKLENVTNLLVLEKLQVFKNNLQEVSLEDLPMLTDLDLSYNQLSSAALNDIWKMKSLTSLQLHRNNLKNIKGIEVLTNLKTVKLEFNQLSDVSELDQLPNLIFVSVAENPLPKEEIQKWTDFSVEKMEEGK